MATGEFVKSDLYFAGVTFDNTGQEFPRTPDAAERASLAALADDIARGYKKLADNKVAQVQRVLGTASGNLCPDSMHSMSALTAFRAWMAAWIGAILPVFNSSFLRRQITTSNHWLAFGQHWSGRCKPEAPGTTRRQLVPRSVETDPVTTVTDVSAEKDFNIGETALATAFVEVRNFFGQRDDLSTGFRTIQYGLSLPPPGDGKFDQFGDTNELTRYNDGLGRPRSIVLGARFKF